MKREEILELIKERRSIRKYTDKKVKKQSIEKLVEAARWSPSGGNLQPYIIKAVRGEKADKVTTFSPGIYGDPPVILVFCIDEKQIKEKGSDGPIKYMDVAVAAQNVCLEATDINLGTCFCRSFNKEAVKKILDIKERFEPELLLTVGHPDEVPSPPKKKNFEKISEWVGWDE